MVALNFHTLDKVVLPVLIAFFFISKFTTASSTPPTSESPSAQVELICHTDNPAECYPRVFSPTEDFQVVHDDQDLPPGLHVQLDIQTGQKQAKLYNPADENSALEGLPIDKGVVVIDPESPQDSPHVPAGAPKYEPVGMVREPKEKNEDFAAAVQTVKDHSKVAKHVQSDVLDKAVEVLDELSHDMYYGLMIAEDPETVESLLCLLRRTDVADGEDKSRIASERPDFLASTILASSLRNNVPALNAIVKSWASIGDKQCKSTGDNRLRDDLYLTSSQTRDPALVSRLVRVLGALLKTGTVRDEFRARDGMGNLLELMRREGVEWDTPKAKIAQIVQDTFLNEELGATLGEFPSHEKADAATCAGSGPESGEDGCWEYHLEQILDRPAEEHNWEWVRELLGSIKERRPQRTLIHNEL
ncbi:hypothetical protein F5Y15DRAFT_400172 [Xylariaceae sp. FL0016]|nr:hypothetical protein F5Y15DRAFT_400172 [Xylariaceae sp. FL0016]